MEKLTGQQQEGTPLHNRVYYHGISGRRLESFLKTGIIPAAQQAFGGEFSITDDYDIAKGHAGDNGVVLEISVEQNTKFEYADPFAEDYFPYGDISDIGESEFIVNNPETLYSIKIMKENIKEGNELKGGKADNMSVEDIAKKHKVSVADIEKEIGVGMTIEGEHTNSKKKKIEIVMDHLIEDPKYYTDRKTGLLKKEKEAEERMNEMAQRMKALAGIKDEKKIFEKSDVNSDEKERFFILEFEQDEFEPGEGDDKLYRIK